MLAVAGATAQDAKTRTTTSNKFFMMPPLKRKNALLNYSRGLQV
tara:strand:- start:1614 stop:1745 length:132 start_codon:yes stop_codon:yes gene_type:complete